MTSSFPKSLDTIYGGAEQLSKYVAEMTDNKFQIQVFAAGELVAGPAGARCDFQRHESRCATPSPTIMSARIRLSPSTPRCRSASTRASRIPGGTRAAAMELGNEFFKKFERDRISVRQHRHPDGRLVPQGDQDGCRSVRPQDCASAALPVRSCRRSAWCRSSSRAVISIRRWKKGTIDAAVWVGPYDDEKLGFAKVAKYYYYPGFWEGGSDRPRLHQSRQVNSLPKSSRRSSPTRWPMPTPGWPRATTCRTRRR